MPAYCCVWNYKNNPETYVVDIKPYEMTMLYIPTTWRHSNDGSNVYTNTDNTLRYVQGINICMYKLLGQCNVEQLTK